jgi:Amiloride-sensitive sodium channel
LEMFFCLFLRKRQLLALKAYYPLGFHFDDKENYTNCNKCLATLRQLKIPRDEIFFECIFKDQVIDCDSMFEDVHMENGVMCYTFNGLGMYRKNNESYEVKEWTIDEGYTPTASLDAYPYRATGVGPKFGFTILLGYKKTALEEFLDNRFGFLVKNYPLKIICKTLTRI